MKKAITFELPSITLSYKQKLILDVLQDEFHGVAFGPELLKDSENKDLKNLTINEVTWHMLRLRDAGLVKSEKKKYEGRILNEYYTTPVVAYKAINIK